MFASPPIQAVPTHQRCPTNGQTRWMVLAMALVSAVSVSAKTGTAIDSGTAMTAAATAQPSPSSKAQLSLEDIVRIILAHNPQLRATEMGMSVAQAGVTTAKAFPNPRLEAIQGRNVAQMPGLVTGPVRGWGVSQPLENPALRGARADAARAKERESGFEVIRVRNELIAQVRSIYYQCLQHQAHTQAASDAVQLLEQVRERVRLRVSTGEAPRYEIIKADAEIISARERLQTASLMVEHNQLELNRLAAGQLPHDWKLAGELDQTPEMQPVSQLVELVLKNNPALLVLQAEQDRALARLSEARSERLPGVELRYSQVRDAEWRQNQLSVGVQLPLLDTRQGPIAQASAELQRAQIRLEGHQAQLLQQVMLAWKSMEMARLRIEALSQGALREAEAALRVAQAAYRFGERGILDVLDAQRVLRSVRTDLIDARFQLQAARIALEELTGQHSLSNSL
ncbi:TolC family protein [Limnohabitans sp. DM1]|uniref:TolC family protein n=1 Tax=Limnohabitans sp. DM1 TaxID=1597955 RepID=UPI000B0C8BF6|nr:TolC family protein [Limnohabitans sp. DM1]